MLRKSYRRLKKYTHAQPLLLRRNFNQPTESSHAPIPDPTTEPRTANCRPGKRLGPKPRWKGVKRGYTAADVVRLRGSLQPQHTLAQRGAEKLWEKVNGGATKGYVNAFGAISPAGQAMQQAKAGLEAVYLSGWQVAADGNTSETMYPDQSLYAYDSVPTMVRRINNTFKRADEIQWSRGINPGDQEFIDYFRPSWRMRKPVSVACSTPSS